ncbi:hypothetical protein [Pleomorphomonas sp. PLEO]|uniref:hypothetical protein n=1 Tax=Pleomorphomonas sp. PLEO TaxID=3239306 RepID=UPI00351E4CAD
MTTLDARRHSSPQRGSDASTHVFRIGESVHLKPSFQYASLSGVYRITATLPTADGQPQYRIRNEEERHERVAPQDSLERATASSTGGTRAMLIKRTFGRG